MSAQNAQYAPGPWLVTYYNPATEKRHSIIENIDEATADAVVDRFGDNGDAFCRLPDVRKECAKATGAAS